MKKFSELNEKDKRSLLLDIATVYGRTSSARTISERHGVKFELIASLAMSMRKRGVNLPKARPMSFFTPALVQELNEAIATA